MRSSSLRIAPEHVKGLVEQFALVLPVDEDRVQGPVEILPAREADRFDGANGVEHFARPDGQARDAQGAREMHEVGDQALPPLGLGSGAWPEVRARPRARARP